MTKELFVDDEATYASVRVGRVTPRVTVWGEDHTGRRYLVDPVGGGVLVFIDNGTLFVMRASKHLYDKYIVAIG